MIFTRPKTTEEMHELISEVADTDRYRGRFATRELSFLLDIPRDDLRDFAADSGARRIGASYVLEEPEVHEFIDSYVGGIAPGLDEDDEDDLDDSDEAHDFYEGNDPGEDEDELS